MFPIDRCLLTHGQMSYHPTDVVSRKSASLFLNQYLNTPMIFHRVFALPTYLRAPASPPSHQQKSGGSLLRYGNGKSHFSLSSVRRGLT